MSANVQLEKAAMNLRKGARSAQAGVGEYAREVTSDPKAAAASVSSNATPSWASWVFTGIVVSLVWGRTVLDNEDDEFTFLDAGAVLYLTVVVMGVLS